MKQISIFFKTEHSGDRNGGLVETLACEGYVAFQQLLEKYKGKSFIAKWGERTVAEGRRHSAQSALEASIRLVRDDGSSYPVWEQWRRIAASDYWFTL